MKTGNNNNVWVVLPTLNEKENLEWILPSLTPFYNVVVVDNGSKDGSLTTAKNLGAHTTTCAIRGYGAAVKTGINFALKNYTNHLDGKIIIFDADGTSPMESISDMISLQKDKSHDLIIGQRVKIQRNAMPLHAKWGNEFIVQCIRLLTGKKYIEMGSTRLLTFEAYKQLEMIDQTWGWNVEMQMKAAFRKLSVGETFLEYKPRKFGKSKISGNLIGTIRATSKILFAIVYYYYSEQKQCITNHFTKPQTN